MPVSRCPKCGTQRDADDRFCMLCGYDFQESAATHRPAALTASPPGRTTPTASGGLRLLLAVVGFVVAFNAVLEFLLYLVPGHGQTAAFIALGVAILVGIVIAVRGVGRLLSAFLWGGAASVLVMAGVGLLRYMATGDASREGSVALIALLVGVLVGIAVAARGR